MRALLICVAALILAAPAAAGGWATVGLGPPPGGMGPGDTWNAEMTILQHGNPLTPLQGLAPEVIIRNDKGDEHRFAAKPTGKPGVYVAEVKFPSGGEWRYLVNDDFSRTHSFAPVQIGPVTADGGRSFPMWPFAVAAALAAIAVALLLARRLRPAAAPAPQ
jgi:hypothetical protein